MRFFVHIGKFTWRCGCFACHCVNIGLLVLALLQTGLIGLNLVQKEIPFPDKFASWVLNELGQKRYLASWSKAVFDLRAGLLLSDFTLKDAATEQIIITASETRLEWSPMSLILKELAPFSEMDAREIQVYVPSSISPSGLNEPVLHIHNAAMHEQAGQIILTSMIIQCGEIDLFLTGSAPLDLVRGTPSSQAEPQLIPILQRLSRLPQNLAAEAKVHWQLLPSGTHVFSVQGLVPELELGGSLLSSLEGRARVRIKQGQTALMDLDLSGFVSRIQPPAGLDLPDTITSLPPFPFHLAANGPLRLHSTFYLPTAIRLSLHPRHPSGLLDNLILETNYWDNASPVHFMASGNRLFAAGMAFPDQPGAPVLPPALSFRAYFPSPALQDYLPGTPPNIRLENLHADFLRLNASFSPQSRSLRGSLACDGLFIARTFFANVHARRFHIDPVHLRFPDIHARKAFNESANGSYSQHLPSSRFSLIAAGSIFPSSLDFLLGQWWVDIFTHIEAQHPLAGDVTVWGLWSEMASLQSMTQASGGGASYRGVAVPRLDIRVRSNADWALVEALEGEFQDGRVRGTVALRSGLEDWERLRAIRIDLESDAPWEAVVAASGLEQLGSLTFRGNPNVRARGWIWQDSGQGHTAEPVAKLQLDLVQQAGDCGIAGMTFEGLALEGRVEGQRLELENLTGRFAEGVFSGSLMVENWPNKERQVQEYELHLFDADFSKAVEQLTSLMANPEPLRRALEKESTGGRLDTRFSLKRGPATAASKGEGSILLRDARIGQIHLFGGLSRFLSNLGMGFSSLDLTTATLDWQLADDVLTVGNGIINGPALTLSLSGQVDLAQERLAMQADVTLFEGLISKILSPVSETLEFDLTGPIAEPDWQVRISPLRWFQRRMTSPQQPEEP